MPQSGDAKQHCSRDRGERALSFQDCMYLGIVQVTDVTLSIFHKFLALYVIYAHLYPVSTLRCWSVSACLVQMWDASQAAWMASSQYSWCLPAVVANSSKLNSSKNQSSSSKLSEPSVGWWSIFLSNSTLLPALRSWTRTQLYIHWVCVTWRSWVISQDIHCVAWEEDLLHFGWGEVWKRSSPCQNCPNLWCLVTPHNLGGFVVSWD